VEFLKSAGISGHMFNSYGLGGYLIWRLWPDQRVFIDGREDVYLKPGVLAEYVHAFDSRENWLRIVGKYAVDYAVVRYPEQPPSSPERSLDYLAFPRQDWGLVYFDDVAAVYVRRNGRNDAALGGEIRMVQPLQVSGYLDGIVADPAKLAAFVAEMEANARAHGMSFRNRFTLGLLALKRGPQYFEEARRHFQSSAAINPDFAPSHVNLGSVCLHLKRYDEAESAYRKALELGPNQFVEQQLRKLQGLRGS
jgi:tetratricopeptide (TPR) repeat protein